MKIEHLIPPNEGLEDWWITGELTSEADSEIALQSRRQSIVWFRNRAFVDNNEHT